METTAPPAKLAPGTKVRILNPVIVGTVETKYGVLKHLGRCLEKTD